MSGLRDAPPQVSVVIPTIGRASLTSAVESALAQTYPVREIIVVVDSNSALSLPESECIVVVRSRGHVGPSACRQLGIDVATGKVIALLDDDDEWLPDKLRRQIDAVGARVDGRWIASCRIAVEHAGKRRRVWPRRIIEPGQAVADYLYRFTGVTFGGAVLQTSTLCFPTEIAREIRWDARGSRPHDEPSWLIRVQSSMPDVRFVQVPDVLSVYHVDGPSISRSSRDRTDEYLAWGLRYLSGRSRRVLGDYLCTSPVSAAVAARSTRGILKSIATALRYGRPGPWALTYAALNAARVPALRALELHRGFRGSESAVPAR